MCEQVSAMLESKLPKLVCGEELFLPYTKPWYVLPLLLRHQVVRSIPSFSGLLNSSRLPFSANARDREGFGNHITLL